MKKSSGSLGRRLEQNVNFGYLHVFEFGLVNTRYYSLENINWQMPNT
jgi:hypothetical protein